MLRVVKAGGRGPSISDDTDRSQSLHRRHADRRHVDDGANPAHVCAEIARAVPTEAGNDRRGIALEEIEGVRQAVLKAAIDQHLAFGDRRQRADVTVIR